MGRSIHPTAIVSGSARLGDGVRIGPYVIIEDGTELGESTEVRAHAVIKRHTRLGAGNVVFEGAVLGGEPQDLGFRDTPTALLIGDGNTIREGVTIHRASKPGAATVIGDDCFLMAYAHVAHDDQIGDRVILANNVVLAGHVEVGDRAFLSGGAGVHQFCRVGRLAMIGGNAKIVQDCLPFVITDGVPARARGLNLVGLRRAGVPVEQLATLKRAYRLLLRSALSLPDALSRLAALQDPLVDELGAFTRGGQRGFHRASGRRDSSPVA